MTFTPKPCPLVSRVRVLVKRAARIDAVKDCPTQSVPYLELRFWFLVSMSVVGAQHAEEMEELNLPVNIKRLRFCE